MAGDPDILYFREVNRYQLWILIFLLVSCKQGYQKQVSGKRYITINKDSSWVNGPRYLKTQKLIAPYKEVVDRQVDEQIGESLQLLSREKPEGTLGNLVADAVYEQAIQQKIPSPSFCVLNYGGLRLPSIGKGPITVGKIFELMPFENEVVLLHIQGSIADSLFQLAAVNGGWPVSGATCNLHDKRAVNIRIRGTELDPDSMYWLATSDYLALGGDQATFLIHASSITYTGIKVRDAIVGYIKTHSPLNLQPEGRMKIISQP